jgi:hypothetical protein
MGPKDIKNRPFCAAHVGKVYTVAEIKELDNDQKTTAAVGRGSV